MNQTALKIFCLIVVLLLLWSPWFTNEDAERALKQSRDNLNQRITDGCGLNNMDTITRVPFGVILKTNETCSLGKGDFTGTYYVTEFNSVTRIKWGR